MPTQLRKKSRQRQTTEKRGTHLLTMVGNPNSESSIIEGTSVCEKEKYFAYRKSIKQARQKCQKG